jgi:hypothetical protein
MDFVMIIISIISGLMASMNAWAVDESHIRFGHMNDIYMALIMTAWMITLMGIWHMNFMYIILGVISIIAIKFLINNQTFVTRSQFMKGMIPHHSMAIRMAKEVINKTNDPFTIQLAHNIIKSQSKEIKQMIELGY